MSIDGLAKKLSKMVGKALWGILLAVMLAGATVARADVGAEELAGQLSEALRVLANQNKTAAFWRIENADNRFNVDQFIDYANVLLVRERILQMVDRSKLSLILKEQQIQLSDLVSSSRYRELGKIVGVDLFIYGHVYDQLAVFKAVDVENSSIVWADAFALNNQPVEDSILFEMADAVVASLQNNEASLLQEKINKISFWSINSSTGISGEALIDAVTVRMVQSGVLTVIDRQNLQVLAREQRLNQSSFIDAERAKSMGELHGVDGFIYGGIDLRRGTELSLSMKLLNVFTGVIAWADLIKFDTGALSAAKGQVSMRLIPAGEFIFGSPNRAQKLWLDEFYIDANEVTNDEYAQFIKKTGAPKPANWRSSMPADDPVIGVNWHEAQRYCKVNGKKLPTEQQWEKAARGNAGNMYPWRGSGFSARYTNTLESGLKDSISVYSPTADVSPYRLRFAAGNVREWVDASQDGQNRIIKGASWATPAEYAKLFNRQTSLSENAWPDVGFRCVQSKS